MCDSCGCHTPENEKDTRTLEVHESLLAANTRQADENRKHFDTMGAVAINLISSPGSGKTTLLEQTIKENLAVTSPDDITLAVMNQIRVEYAKSTGRSKLWFVPTIIGLSCLGMIAILFLFLILPAPETGQNGFTEIGYTFWDFIKTFARIWKLKFIPIFIISFSLAVFIDVFFIRFLPELDYI